MSSSSSCVGATAIQVGTASFWDPARVADLPAELESYLDAEGTAKVAELTGKLRPPAGSGLSGRRGIERELEGAAREPVDFIRREPKASQSGQLLG